MKKHCDSGLDGRCRDMDGTIRRKRGDTLVGKLRETYGDDFTQGVRSDRHQRIDLSGLVCLCLHAVVPSFSLSWCKAA